MPMAATRLPQIPTLYIGQNQLPTVKLGLGKMPLICSNTSISPLQILPNSSFSRIIILKNLNSVQFTYNFPEIIVSSIPSFLNPNSLPQRLHCCTSSSSSIVEDEYHSAIVFIKGLPQATSEGSLKRAFSQFGEVDRVKIITDKKNKQPLGFAYIWFTKEESAQMAVKEMNGKFFEGRFVMVTIARPGSCKTRVETTPYKF